MKPTALTGLLFLALGGNALALSIEDVVMMRDAGGEAGEEVDSFAPGDHVQHFKITLDEMKVGQHEYTVEFWAAHTSAGDDIKVADFAAGGLLANTIDAQVSLPRDWPTGEYRLDVMMDGEKIGSYEYEVAAE